MSFFTDKALSASLLHKDAPDLVRQWSASTADSFYLEERGATDAGSGSGVRASFRSALANLVMSTLGAGQLTLPFVISRMGVVLGCGSILLCGLLSIYSGCALARCSQKFRAATYSDLLSTAFGPRTKVFVDILIALYAWAGGVAFLIIIKEQLRSVASAAQLWPAHAADPGATLMILLAAMLIFPLSLLRKLDRLKFTSAFGCAAAFAITSTVIVTAPWGPTGLQACAASAQASRVKLLPDSAMDVFAALPLIAFALNSSWAFLNILGTLDRRSQRDSSTRLIVYAIGIILGNYYLMSIIGYLSYCGATAPNIMDSLSQQVLHGWRALLALTVRAILVLQLALALPLRFNVARCVVAGWCPSKRTAVHVAITAGLVLSAVGLAASPLKLNIAIGVTSAVCASFISYIFPAGLELAALRRDADKARLSRGRVAAPLLALGMASFGFLLLLAGTYANLSRIGRGS